MHPRELQQGEVERHSQASQPASQPAMTVFKPSYCCACQNPDFTLVYAPLPSQLISCLPSTLPRLTTLLVASPPSKELTMVLDQLHI